MSQFGSTFRSKALTYVEAAEQHETVAKAAKEFIAGNPDRAKHCIELWESLVDLRDEEDKNAISDCVDITMPIEFIPMMRRADSMAATFAFDLILTAIKSADLEDDLELKPLFHQAWREFNKRRMEANKVEEGMGCGDSPSWHTLRDIYDVDDNEGQWKKRILEIAKLAGKMHDLIKPIGKKVKSDDPQEVEGVMKGGEVERLLPEEIALLGQDETRDIKAMEILKEEAGQLKMKGVRVKGRGPLVILIDESGSMHDFGWGNHGGKRGRNTWAKACAIALIRIAWSEGREAMVVHFGVGCVVQEIPKDDTHALFEMARSFMSGGTAFGRAMDTGIKEVKDLEKRGFKGADIVLITDGEEYDHTGQDQRINVMDKLGIDLWTVAIGDAFQTDSPARKRAKMYVHAQDQKLGDDSTAVNLVDGLQEAAMDNPEDE